MKRGGFYHRGGAAFDGEESRKQGKVYDSKLILRIAAYLRPQIGLIGIATFLLVLFSILSLVGPLITSIGIDRYIAAGDAEGLWQICILWFVLRTCAE